MNSKLPIHYIKPNHRSDFEKMFLALQVYCAAYPYEVFGVNQYTTLAQIQRIYYELQQLFHPDVSNYPSTFSQKINKAYEMCRKGNMHKPIESNSNAEFDSFFTEIIKKINNLITQGNIDKETERKLKEWVVNTSNILREHAKIQKQSAEIIENNKQLIAEFQAKLSKKSGDKTFFKNQF